MQQFSRQLQAMNLQLPFRLIPRNPSGGRFPSMRNNPSQFRVPVDLDLSCEAARVMVVDDEPMVTRIVAKQLLDWGFQNICTENDPCRALESIGKFRPDVILLDIMMPQIGGLELLQTIRSKPEYDDIVVVMLSAASKTSKYKALNLGAVDFIDKPIDFDILVKQLRNALRII
jgi:DNA-binding response OmpR family regulator